MSDWEQLHREHSKKNREQEILQSQKRGIKKYEKGSVSDYYYRLSGTKKWWGRSDSIDYIEVIDMLKILNHLENDKDALDDDKGNLYYDLRDKCTEYLRNHSGDRWTFVGKKRYKLISELSKLLDSAINRKKIGQMQTTDIIPYLVDNEESEKLIKHQSESFKDKPIYGEGGFIDDFINGRVGKNTVDNQNQDSDKKSDNVVESRIDDRIKKVLDINKNKGTDVHIGNRFIINGLIVGRMFTQRYAKGWHMDKDEIKNWNYMETVFNNLMAGDKIYDRKKSQSQDIKSEEELNENEKSHLEGMRQYKEVMYKHYEYIYKKYGKYLYQLHPVDILSRSDNFKEDIMFAQELNQYFGFKFHEKTTIELLEKDFYNNLKKNPILKFIFPEEERDRDLFFLKLAVYYNDSFACITIFDSNPQYDILAMKELFKKEMVDANVTLEKDIEKHAKEYGLGEMKGLSESEKEVYLLNLKRRNLDKEFDLGDRLLSKGTTVSDYSATRNFKGEYYGYEDYQSKGISQIMTDDSTISDYYDSLAATKSFKGGYGYEDYKALLRVLLDLTLLLEDEKDESDYIAKHNVELCIKSLQNNCDNYLAKNREYCRKTTTDFERYILIQGLRRLLN